jgi:hypothetical protein
MLLIHRVKRSIRMFSRTVSSYLVPYSMNIAVVFSS